MFLAGSRGQEGQTLGIFQPCALQEWEQPQRGNPETFVPQMQQKPFWEVQSAHRVSENPLQ